MVYQRTGGKIAWDAVARPLAARAELQASRPPASPNGSGAEHPLFLLYTSGSTGKPKGVQHCTRRLPAACGADHASGPST